MTAPGDILILSTTGTLLARLDAFLEFKEALRYFGVSAFEFTLSPQVPGASSVVRGNLLKTQNDDDVYLIEQIERQLDADGTEVLVAKGRTAGMLTERLCEPPFAWAYDVRNSAAETAMKGYVEANAVARNLLLSDRAIPDSLYDWASTTNTITFTLTQVAIPGYDGGSIQAVKAVSAGDLTFGNPVGTAATPVLPNTVYTVMARSKPASTVRNFKVDVTWYTAAGATISTSTGVSIAGVGGSFKQWRGLFTSPATAAFVRMVPTVLSTIVGETHYWGGFGIFEGDVQTWSLTLGGGGNRRVTNLVVAADQGRGSTVYVSARYQYVSSILEEIGVATGMGWKVALSGTQLVFDVIVGTDRSTTVFFSPKFDAVDTQGLLDTEMGRKNYAVVAGQGDGASRQIIRQWITSEPTGWARRELFVDARDVDVAQATAGALATRGLQRLNETAPIQSFQMEANAFGNFRFKVHWFLGDIVTVRNEQWGVSKTARVVKVERTVNRQGEITIEIEFDQAWREAAHVSQQAAGGLTGGDGGSGAVDYHSEDHGSRHLPGGLDPIGLTAVNVGALPITGGTLTGPLTIGSPSGTIHPAVAANANAANAPSTYPLGITLMTLNTGALALGWPADTGVVITHRDANDRSTQRVVETNTGVAWTRASNTAGTGWTAFARLLNSKTKRAHAYRTTTQSIANNTDSVVTYNTESYDIGGIYDLAGNPDRFTMSEIGLWLVYSNVRFIGGGVSAERYMGIFKGATLTVNRYAHSSSTTSGAASLNASAIVQATAVTDIVRTVVFQASGGALNLQPDFTYSIAMGVVFIGDSA